jgi:hypothetical protein
LEVASAAAMQVRKARTGVRSGDRARDQLAEDTLEFSGQTHSEGWVAKNMSGGIAKVMPRQLE